MRIRCLGCFRNFDSMDAFDSHTCDGLPSPAVCEAALAGDAEDLDEALAQDGTRTVD